MRMAARLERVPRAGAPPSQVAHPTLPVRGEWAGRIGSSVLVTGATGFIGRRLVEALLGRGARVRALVRDPSVRGRIPANSAVGIHRGDLLDRTSLDGALDGVDAVVHLAARVQGPVAATIAGTRNLLQLMVEAGVDRLVLASSFSVYDWDRVGDALDEESPVRLDDDELERYGEYARAKVLQERLVREHCEENDWRLSVVRPGVVWGKERAYPPGLGHRVGSIHLVIGSRLDARLTHVSNCADAFAAVLADERSIGQTFNVVDGHRIREDAYLRRYLDSRGERGVRIPFPYGPALVGVRAVHALATAMGVSDRLPSIMVPCRFRSRFQPVTCSAAHISSILGWTAPYGLTQCLEATFGRPLE